MSNDRSTNAKAFFEKASIYLANRPSIRLRSEIIQKMLKGRNGLAILDIGCGDGSLSLPLVGMNHVTFLDFSSAMLQEVKKRIPQEHKTSAVLLESNFEDHVFHEQFDVILCVGVLAHVRDVDSTIHKIAGLLKPKGYVIFQISDVRHWYYRIQSAFRRPVSDQYNYRLNSLTTKMLMEKSKAEGLQGKIAYQYPVVYPLLRFLGTSFVFSFLKFVSENSWLKFLASEHVVLFEKK